jgi:hypothetical protein
MFYLYLAALQAPVFRLLPEEGCSSSTTILVRIPIAKRSSSQQNLDSYNLDIN